ncbi:hypothetical protein MBLNU230_g6988t1 [Neophaeotheca triangularis]
MASTLFPILALASCVLGAPTDRDLHGHRHDGIQPHPHHGHWVDTWVSMPQLVEPRNLPPEPFNQTGVVFDNATLRQTLHMSIGAEQIRVRVSNAFGVNELPVTKMTVAYPIARDGYNASGSPFIDENSVQTLTFSGNESISIPNGGLAVSDPINFSIAPESVLTIDMYLEAGQQSNLITGHPGSRTGSFISFGDHTGSGNFTDAGTVETFHWYFASAVEAWSKPHTSGFVIIGDSITDGRGSDNNGNNRWPDLLLGRMQGYGPTKDIAVLNQAAGGNRILRDGLGPNVVSRVDRDLLAQSGIKYAMMFEGVNDIGSGNATVEAQTEIGDRLIQFYQQTITRSHTFGIPMWGSTITPFGCANTTLQPYSDPVREETRLRVNEWIRNSGAFDYVVDFDEVARDPSNFTRLNPALSSGDCIHPNPSGYQEMADYFPLRLFQEFERGVSTFT